MEAEAFCKKGVLKNFTEFAGKHLCQSFFFNKSYRTVYIMSPLWLKRELLYLNKLRLIWLILINLLESIHEFIYKKAKINVSKFASIVKNVRRYKKLKKNFKTHHRNISTIILLKRNLMLSLTLQLLLVIILSSPGFQGLDLNQNYT